MKEQIKKWQEDIGFAFIVRPGEDILKKIIGCDGVILNSVEMEELDNILMSLSNYYLFLQSTVGETSARVNYLKSELDKHTNVEAAKKTGGHFSERKALAMVDNSKLELLSSRLIEEQVKLEMLVHVSNGIKSKIDIIKKIYDRRVRSYEHSSYRR